jgi:hypothetical protein
VQAVQSAVPLTRLLLAKTWLLAAVFILSGCSRSEETHSDQPHQANAATVDRANKAASREMTAYVRSLNGMGHQGYVDAKVYFTSDSGCELWLQLADEAAGLSAHELVTRDHARYLYDERIDNHFQDLCERKAPEGMNITASITALNGDRTDAFFAGCHESGNVGQCDPWRYKKRWRYTGP